MLILFSGLGGGGGGGLSTLSIGIEMGLHASSFRDTLIDASFSVGVWPLAEVQSTRATNIVANKHHGTFTGTGWVRGVPNGLPEGGLGVTMDGTQHIEVLDDSADGANLNLSLANGDVDIVFLIKTTTNDATNRCIVQKMVTDANGNGWSVSLVNGAIRWREEIAGVQQFSFDRGSIADGAWHLVHCCKRTTVGTGEAFISIEGVQSGATQTGASLELGVTAANMRIGMFNDGSGGFIGTLSYVSIGREGDDDLGAALEACRPWTDITEDTRASMPMVIRYGIQGTRPIDNVAHSGTCVVGLDNSTSNSGGVLGLYSLDHVNKRTNFRKGAPLRVVIEFEGVTYYKHVGRMVSALPSPGSKRERLTRVTSADWMDVAASSRLKIPSQTAIDSDAVIGLAIDQALRPPHAVAISPGAETFDYALHLGYGGRESIMSEASRTCTSEFGFFYIKGDTVQGGVVTFEGRADRQTETTAVATFTDTMSGLQPNDGQKPNLLLVTIHPVEVDATPTAVLFSMTARQPIPPGETVEIHVDYRDPNNAARYVGGTAIVTPVITTDYTMNASEDGTGANLSTSVSIAETGDDLGGTNAVLTVTNEGSQTGWFTTQIRGKAIRHEDPVTIPTGDAASIRSEGPTEETLDLAYINSREFAQDIGEHILALYADSKIASISFVANTSAAMMLQALAREIGDRIDIVETMQSGSVPHAYVINHVEFQVTSGGIIRCTWGLGPVADTGAVWLVGVAGSSEAGETTVPGL